jgi:hypothetical protein
MKNEIQCDCCKRPVTKLTPRYVAIKKKILNICDTCIAHYVTYDPADWIEDGDATIMCTGVIKTEDE